MRPVTPIFYPPPFMLLSFHLALSRSLSFPPPPLPWSSSVTECVSCLCSGCCADGSLLVLHNGAKVSVASYTLEALHFSCLYGLHLLELIYNISLSSSRPAHVRTEWSQCSQSHWRGGSPKPTKNEAGVTSPATLVRCNNCFPSTPNKTKHILHHSLQRAHLHFKLLSGIFEMSRKV